MNDPVVWRLVWKEYRLLRSFWLGLAVVTVALQLLVAYWPTQSDFHDRVTPIFVIAFVFTALYELACGATMFATEKEEGTFELLRALPLDSRRLLAGKLVHAILSTLAFLLVLWVISWTISRFELPPSGQQRAFWTFWATLGFQLLAFGMLFSLLLRRPLIAAVLGAAVSSVVAHSIRLLFSANLPRSDTLYVFYLNDVPWLLGVSAVVLAIDVWLALHWLEERPFGQFWSRLFSPRPITSSMTTLAVDSPAVRRPPYLVGLGRLVWQSWHQSWRTMAVLAGASLFLTYSIALIINYQSRNQHAPNSLLAAVVMSVFITAPLLSSSLFLSDQQQYRFRFLAEQGVSGRQIWFSRQIVGVVVSLACALVAGAAAFALFLLMEGTPWLSRGNNVAELQETVLLGAGYFILAFAVGQFCSLLMRSGLIAGFSALLFTSVLYGWSSLMYELSVPLWWSVAPIPLVLFGVSWLRAPGWLLERTGWRERLRITAALLLPMFGIFAAVIAYRVYEIPAVDPGIVIANYIRPRTAEEKATADLYEQAMRDLKPIDEPPKESDYPGEEHLAEASYTSPSAPLNSREVAWVKANQKSIDLALQATRRPTCRFRGPDSYFSFDAKWDPEELGHLLVTNAMLLSSEGHLDKALERYLAALHLANNLRQGGTVNDCWTANRVDWLVAEHLPYWAAAPAQTPQRIKHALDRFTSLDKQQPGWESALAWEYRVFQQLINGTGPLCTDPNEVKPIVYLNWFLPWERFREQRLLDVLIQDNVTILQGLDWT